MVLVSSHLLTTPSLLMLDAEIGIGTTKFVLLAQRDTHSIQTKSVLQSVINVNLTTLQDNAQLASKATILSMVLVSSHLLTTPSLLMLDAENGIGTIKFVFNALIDGFLTQTSNVSPSMITALTMIPTLEPVLLVHLDMFSLMVNVF